MSAIIIGGGFAGIGIAIQMKKHGMHDFVILERADDVGGVWRDNVYPGCACDVPSHLYSFSFEPKPDWSRHFGPQAEIHAYLKHCVDKYALAPHLRLGDGVSRCEYDEASAAWSVHTEKGLTHRATFLLNGMGGLSNPAMPDIEGLDDFAGPAFHSARWDHGADLDGKRVAVIGTGASAIQFVPGIIDRVGHLDLYQRSAPWVMPKEDGDIPQALKALYRRSPAVHRMARERIYWKLEARILAMVKNPKLMTRYAETAALAYLGEQVKDPQLRATLTPDYRMGCKRILLSNDWYRAITQDKVDVLTTGIERITAGGVVDRQGVERPVDVIILGTGFQAQSPVKKGTFLGRGGLDLAAHWGSTPTAFKGATVHGFPNLFMLGGPNTGIGHTSMIYMLEAQFAYAIDAMRLMEQRGLRSVEVRKEYQDAYNERLQRQTTSTIWGTGCSGWYFNADGVNTTLWPNFTFLFRRQLERFDTAAYHLESLRATEAPTPLMSPPPAGAPYGKGTQERYDLSA